MWKLDQTKAGQEAVKHLGARVHFVDSYSPRSEVECDDHRNAATHAALVAHSSAADSTAASLVRASSTLS